MLTNTVQVFFAMRTQLINTLSRNVRGDEMCNTHAMRTFDVVITAFITPRICVGRDDNEKDVIILDKIYLSLLVVSSDS